MSCSIRLTLPGPSTVLGELDGIFRLAMDGEINGTSDVSHGIYPMGDFSEKRWENQG